MRLYGSAAVADVIACQPIINAPESDIFSDVLHRQ